MKQDPVMGWEDDELTENPEDNRRLLSKIASSTQGTFNLYERKEIR